MRNEILKEDFIFCGGCEKKVGFHLLDKKEVYPVKGEPIEIDARVAVCDECGEEIFHPVYDRINQENAFNVYRKKHNLLLPSEIVEIREMYGLSQRKLSKLLGWGDITIQRYEAGSLPDDAHNLLLKLLKEPDNMGIILEQGRDKLKPKDVEKIKSIIQEHLMANRDKKLEQCVINHSLLNREDISSGFKKFDLERVAAMILFFSENIPDLFKTKLMKCLWFADMLNFKRYAVGISGMQYIHFQHGPVPKAYQYILGLLEEKELIEIASKPIGEFEGEVIVPVERFDESIFNLDELETLSDICEKFKLFTTRQISDFSHEERGYKETRKNEVISYEFAESLSIN